MEMFYFLKRKKRLPCRWGIDNTSYIKLFISLTKLIF